MKIDKKIAIITTFRELNYGAVLQSYATQFFLNSNGYSSELVFQKNIGNNKYRDLRFKKLIVMAIRMLIHPRTIIRTFLSYNRSFNKEFSAESIQLFDEFEREYLKVFLISGKKLRELGNSDFYDKYLCGSDQIWNSYAMYVDPIFYLRFTKKDKRITNSPSFGKSDVPQYNKKIIKKYLNGFERISVREESGAKIVKELTGKEAKVVLDPTMLLTKNEWELLVKNSTKEEYILMYFLDVPNEKTQNSIKRIISKRGVKIKVIPYLNDWLYNLGDFEHVDAGPKEFIELISNANFVLTDSYHGTVFSILFEKDFYTFEREYGGNQNQSTRILHLLEKLNLQNRLFNIENRIGLEKINYNDANILLEKYREDSRNYLLKEIESSY